MSAVMKPTPVTPSYTFDADHDLYNLFTRAEVGQIGYYCYMGEGAKRTRDFYKNQHTYYPHAGEITFLHAEAVSIAAPISSTRHLIIVGPGPAQDSLMRKEAALLPHLPHLQTVHLVDVSEKYCLDGLNKLRQVFRAQNRKILLNSTVAPYEHAADQFAQHHRDHTTVITTGSLISNVTKRGDEAFPDAQIGEFLRSMRKMAGKGRENKVVVGYDACQDEEQVLKSYEGKYFDRFILGGLQRAFELTSHVYSVKPAEISNYFKRVSTWEPSLAHHHVEVVQPLNLVFQARGNDRERFIYLKPGQRFSIMNSVKPPMDLVKKMATQSANLQTRITLGSPDGLVEHVFACS